MSSDFPTHAEENVRAYLRRRMEEHTERGMHEMPEKFARRDEV